MVQKTREGQVSLVHDRGQRRLARRQGVTRMTTPYNCVQRSMSECTVQSTVQNTEHTTMGTLYHAMYTTHHTPGCHVITQTRTIYEEIGQNRVKILLTLFYCDIIIIIG